MSVDIGTAEGHIILDTSGFISGLNNSINSLESFATKVSATFGGALQAAGQAIENFGASIDRYISAPIRQFGKTAFNEMADFEDAMNRAGVIMGANGGEMDKLRDKAIEMGRVTKFSGTQAAEAYGYMGMAGWKSEEAIAGLEGVMNLAAASGENLGTVTDIVTDALTALKMDADETSRFVDVLAQASLNSNTNVGIMGESFKYAASLAGELGYNCEDLGIAFGLMANQGIKGSQAGTAFRSAMMQMMKPTADAQEVMDKYNISLFNLDGTAKPLIQLMGEMRDSFKDVDQQTKVTDLTILGGARGFQFLSTIVGQADESYNKFVDTMSNSQGTAKETADKMQQSFKGQLEILKGVFSTFMLQFEKKVLPIFTKIVENVSEIITKFSNLDEGTQEIIITVGLMAAAIGPLITAIGGVITVIGTALVSIGLMVSTFTTLGALVGVTGGTFAAFAAAVTAAFGIIMVGIALLAGAFADLVINNNDFKSKLLANFDDVKKAAQELGKKIGEILDVAGIKHDTFLQAVQEIWKRFVNIVKPVLEWLVNEIKIVLTTIIGMVTGLGDVFKGILQIFKGEFIEGLKNIIGGAVEVINSFTTGVFQNVLGYIDLIKNSINALRGEATAAAENVTPDTSNSQMAAKAFEKNAKAYIDSTKKQSTANKNLVDSITNSRGAMLEVQGKFAEEYAAKLDEQDVLTSEMAKKIGEDYIAGFEDKAKTMPSVAGEILDNTALKIESYFDYFNRLGESLAIAFCEGTVHWGEQLQYAFADYISWAINKIGEWYDDMKKAGEELVKNFYDKIKEKIGALETDFKATFERIAKLASDWSNTMAARAKEATKKFNDNAIKMANDLSSELDKKLGASLNVANSWVNDMGKKGAEGVEIFLTKMLEVVDQQGDRMHDLGAEIAKNLTYGIESQSEWIKDRLKSAYYKIIDEMEYDMGISSYNPYNAKSAADYGLGYSTLVANAGAGAAQGAAVSSSATPANTTIIFQSPKAIDEVEASRLLRRTQQDMLLGF